MSDVVSRSLVHLIRKPIDLLPTAAMMPPTTTTIAAIQLVQKQQQQQQQSDPLLRHLPPPQPPPANALISATSHSLPPTAILHHMFGKCQTIYSFHCYEEWHRVLEMQP
jgi:hypothetical protein